MTPPAQSEGREAEVYRCRDYGKLHGFVNSDLTCPCDGVEGFTVETWVPKADRDSLRAENETLREALRRGRILLGAWPKLAGKQVTVMPEYADEAFGFLAESAALASLPAAGQEAGR